MNIAESYAVEKGGEIVLINSHISPYKQASYSNHNPTDDRKLLLNKKEINKLIGKMQRDGFTLVPTKMGIAMITFIYSITNTSAAVTLLCLAAMPFFTALLAFLFLREKISLNVWISIIIATVGIIIMALGNTGEKSLIGFVFGLTSSIGFSVFSVTLRWRKETPKFTTVAFAGLFCFVFATIMILSKDLVFFSSSYNGALFSLHGTLVCFGLILYSIGSKAIPAAELTLLSLTEVVGGIFWVWLPLFGINEVPSTNTIIGGFFLFVSIFYYSLIMRWNKRYIALN